MLTEQTHARPESSAPGPTPARTADDVSAWEQIEAGRYMPRRIRGSFPGRELG